MKKNSLSVLIVHSDSDERKNIRSLLVKLGYKVDTTHSHLKGLTLLDDKHYNIVLCSVLGMDIEGMQFLHLCRKRKKNNIYIIICGFDFDKRLILDSATNADDFIISPYLNKELQWKFIIAEKFIHLNKALEQMGGVCSDRGFLNSDGLYDYLSQELNRISRMKGWFSVAVIALCGKEQAIMNYGAGWIEWVENRISRYLRSRLRNYDRFGIMGDNNVCFVFSETDEHGLLTLLDRLSQGILEAQTNNPVLGEAVIHLGGEYLCARLEIEFFHLQQATDIMWQWITYTADKKHKPGFTGEQQILRPEGLHPLIKK